MNLLVGIMTLIVVAVLMQAVATPAPAQSPRPATAQPTHDPAGYQRFIPMPRQPENVTGVPWSGAFALDTKTGQLCRTYDGGVDEKWNGLALCVELYKKF